MDISFLFCSTQSPTARIASESPSLRNEWRQLSGGSKRFAAKAAIIASIGGLLFGYDVGVVEGALPQLTREMNLSLGQQDMVVATMVAGALVGSLVAGFLTDRLGRWLTIVLTDLTFIVGGAALFVAQNPGKLRGSIRRHAFTTFDGSSLGWGCGHDKHCQDALSFMPRLHRLVDVWILGARRLS